jgi:ElaB/YqjD/DUF883 family membrane-anchored ribosome-binding protein
LVVALESAQASAKAPKIGFHRLKSQDVAYGSLDLMLPGFNLAAHLCELGFQLRLYVVHPRSSPQFLTREARVRFSDTMKHEARLVSFDASRVISFDSIAPTGTLESSARCRLRCCLKENKNMDAIREPSVDELRRESERTRAQLTDTVGHLRDKVGETAAEIKTMVSPAHIKQEIRTYVREEREHLTATVQRQIRENPLQAAAIGAAIAYPAWGLLRSIPMPLMLIGAGLFLTSSKGKQTVEAAKEKAADAYRQGSDMAGEMLASAQDQVASQTDAVKDALAFTKDALASTTTKVTDTARSAADAVSAQSSEITQQVQSRVQAAAGQVAGSVDGAMAQAQAKGQEVKDKGRTAVNAVTDFIDQNPILVAGIGAAVGAAIAASFPSSDAENRLFAKPRAALKSKSNELLADGVEKAKDVAASVVGEVAQAAAREGLDADGLKKAVDGIVTGAQTVVDRGLSSALEGVAPKDNQKTSQNPQSTF